MLTPKDAILFKIVHTCAMTPKDAILFKIVHTCAKECLILKYKYIQNPWCYPYKIMKSWYVFVKVWETCSRDILRGTIIKGFYNNVWYLQEKHIIFFSTGYFFTCIIKNWIAKLVRYELLIRLRCYTWRKKYRFFYMGYLLVTLKMEFSKNTILMKSVSLMKCTMLLLKFQKYSLLKYF